MFVFKKIIFILCKRINKLKVIFYIVKMNENNTIGLMTVSCGATYAAGYMMGSGRVRTLSEKVSLGFLAAISLTNLYYISRYIYNRKCSKKEGNGA